MKKCSRCHRIYEDDLSFCLEDGSVLYVENEQATIAFKKAVLNKIHSNQLEGDISDYEIIINSELLDGYKGIAPLETVFVYNLGSETSLILKEDEVFAKTLVKYEIHKRLYTKCGVIETNYGLVGFILYYFLDPFNSKPYFTIYENFVNFTEPIHLKTYWNLARQTHWHLVLLNESGDIIDIVEYTNVFDLNTFLNYRNSIEKRLSKEKFDLALNEITEKYSTDDLFNITSDTI